MKLMKLSGVRTQECLYELKALARLLNESMVHYSCTQNSFTRYNWLMDIIRKSSAFTTFFQVVLRYPTSPLFGKCSNYYQFYYKRLTN